MDHPRPWLRYVAAGDLDDAAFDFDGLDVEGPSGKNLGDVDGFIIDVNSGRPYHLVVNAGGWFRSKYFLLPVGHARLDESRQVLVADLDRDRVERFPGFDKDEFQQLSDEELDRIGTTMAEVCCAGTTTSVQLWYEGSHYDQPAWWQTGYYQPEKMVERDTTSPSERKR
jgi:hypothetical protein